VLEDTMIRGTNYFNAVDLVLILGNYGILGYLTKMLLDKIRNSCSKNEVDSMIDSKIKLIETKVDAISLNLNEKLNQKVETLDVKLDAISCKLDLILKDAHLKLGC
jgi:hypothetical protein